MDVHRYRIAAVCAGQPLLVNIRYTVSRPFSLLFTFVAVPPITWELDRHMVTLGLGTSVGEGDYRVVPRGEFVDLVMAVGHQVGTVTFKRDELNAVIEQTYAVVPPGSEGDHLDWSQFGSLGVAL